jgi:hypothetical protein
MNIAWLVKNIDANIEKLQDQRSIIASWQEEPEGVSIWCGTGDISLTVSDMDGLRTARAYLREMLGHWNDKMTAVFANGGGGVSADFRSKECPMVVIRLAASPEEFPRELLPSEECEIRTEEITQKNVVVACPV